MPFYELLCEACGMVWTSRMATSMVINGELRGCDRCGSGRVRRLFTPPVIHTSEDAADVLNDAAGGHRDAPGMSREETVKATNALAESHKAGRDTSKRNPNVRKPSAPQKFYT